MTHCLFYIIFFSSYLFALSRFGGFYCSLLSHHLSCMGAYTVILYFAVFSR